MVKFADKSDTERMTYQLGSIVPTETTVVVDLYHALLHLPSGDKILFVLSTSRKHGFLYVVVSQRERLMFKPQLTHPVVLLDIRHVEPAQESFHTYSDSVQHGHLDPLARLKATFKPEGLSIAQFIPRQGRIL